MADVKGAIGTSVSTGSANVIPSNKNLQSDSTKEITIPITSDSTEKSTSSQQVVVQTPVVSNTQSTTSTNPTVSFVDAVEQSKQLVDELNNIGVVNAPQVSYAGDTAVQRVLEDVRQVNLLPTLSNEEREKLQENLAVLGTGENQIRMLANAGADSRETANMLANIYTNTSKYGGINLLGATAVLASQRADRAERQRQVANMELEVARRNRALLERDTLTRNNNALLPLKETSDLTLANERLRQQIDLANAGYDMSAQTSNVGINSNVMSNILDSANRQQGLNKAVTVITDSSTNAKKKATTKTGQTSQQESTNTQPRPLESLSGKGLLLKNK